MSGIQVCFVNELILSRIIGEERPTMLILLAKRDIEEGLDIVRKVNRKDLEEELIEYLDEWIQWETIWESQELSK
jgi:hypothetical protein